jgi:hypothetical protein
MYVVVPGASPLPLYLLPGTRPPFLAAVGIINKAYILFGHSNATAFPNVDLPTFTAGTMGFMMTGSGSLATTFAVVLI